MEIQTIQPSELLRGLAVYNSTSTYTRQLLIYLDGAILDNLIDDEDDITLGKDDNYVDEPSEGEGSKDSQALAVALEVANGSRATREQRITNSIQQYQSSYQAVTYKLADGA